MGCQLGQTALLGPTSRTRKGLSRFFRTLSVNLRTRRHKPFCGCGGLSTPDPALRLFWRQLVTDQSHLWWDLLSSSPGNWQPFQEGAPQSRAKPQAVSSRGSADPDRMGLSPSLGVWSAVCWILLSLCSFIYQKQTDNASRATARTVKGNTAQSPEPAWGASVWAVGFMNPGQKVSVWGFPGGLVVRNPHSQCRSCGFNPWSEN